jgi:hypothetical protein
MGIVIGVFFILPMLVHINLFADLVERPAAAVIGAILHLTGIG